MTHSPSLLFSTGRMRLRPPPNLIPWVLSRLYWSFAPRGFGSDFL